MVSFSHAGMRIYSNVPIASFPQAMKDAASAHFFNEGFLNIKSAPYGAKGDGVTDDANAFIAASRDAYGTFLLSKSQKLSKSREKYRPRVYSYLKGKNSTAWH